LIESFNDCHNTTPEVSSNPEGICPPDMGHIKSILNENPDVVVACGRQAEEALRVAWQGPMIAVPHPACRVVTTDVFLKANAMLRQGFSSRIAIRQKKGAIQLENL